MNERTEFLSRVYVPNIAIVVYKTKDRSNDKDDFYLESHSINAAGRFMEGKPLLQDTLAGIVDVFQKKYKELSTLTGFIPECLLKYEPQSGGHYKMIWYQPEQERVIHFAASLGLPSAKVTVPAMMYMVSNKKLHVFALKDNARPRLNTPLLQAPFHNIYDDGSVCLGSAKVKKPTDRAYESAIKYWEDLFWLSEFTHVNGGGNSIKANLGVVWKRLVKSKRKIKWTSINPLKQFQHAKTLKSIL